MKVTIQDIDDVLKQKIELAADSIKKKKLLYCPLTNRYTVLKDMWPEVTESKHEAIVMYNNI